MQSLRRIFFSIVIVCNNSMGLVFIHTNFKQLIFGSNLWHVSYKQPTRIRAHIYSVKFPGHTDMEMG